MIYGVFGLPGDGKSYYMMTVIERVLRDTNLTIITNIQCFPEEIANSLHEKYGNSFNVHSRFRFLTAAETLRFWRYRNGYNLPVIGNADDKDAETDWAKLPEGFEGVYYLIDEVHVHFNARRWAKTGTDALNYISQHRKLGDNVYLISQRPKQVDSQMRGLCGTYIQMRNLGHRQLKWMGVSWTFSRSLHARAYPEECKGPTSEDLLMWTESFKVDPKYYGAWYNTAAGVGIKGNAADTKQHKPKGVPFAVLLTVFALLVCAAFTIPYFMRKATAASLNKLDSYADLASPEIKTAPSAQVQHAPPVEPKELHGATTSTNAPLEVSNIKSFHVGRTGFVTIRLKDNSTITSADGIRLLGAEGFIYKERVYPLP